MAAGELRIDFLSGRIGHRLRGGAGQSHVLLRAVGLRRTPDAHIVDATAGLGRDAFLLASQGARITLIERSETVHDLLLDGMRRAREASQATAAIIDRMTLLHGDARTLLPELRPDVVLVDPMHPARGNTALVKQEMRLLRQIVGADPDAADLVRVALATARRRVVLKWPRRAAPPNDLPKPSHQYLGKTTRHDVFVT